MNDNTDRPDPSSPRDPTGPTWDGIPLVDQPYYETPPMLPPYQPAGGQPAYGQQPYGASLPPGYVPPRPKGSLRWLWIMLSILGGVLILGCVACSIAGVAYLKIFQETLGPVTVAQQYYQAIESQNYNRAYSYVDTSHFAVNGQPVTQRTFISSAELVDQENGPVTAASYTGSTSVTDTPNTTTVTMLVKRRGRSYEVRMQLKKIGNNWKIIGSDGF